KGVPVIGYQTDVLPAFYTRSSDVELTLRADAPEVIAESLKAKWDLQIKGGAVITNPIPEEFAMDEKVINDVIQ
ncbi:pseudouridine-5'-phosphate glycosidase, partial [Escherichia coli]|nr:pseudouridine-5'-phosphate glycosidase [Escherichia coli]